MFNFLEVEFKFNEISQMFAFIVILHLLYVSLLLINMIVSY